MSGGWNTIESDAGVFTFLLDNLGVKGVQFEELISLDPESIQALSPVYGIIFLFKYPSTSSTNTDGTPLDGTHDHDAAEDMFFAAQTIQNACGTQALLSVLLNHDNEEGISIGQKMTEFKEFTSAFPAEFRGEALSNSELIRDVHNSFAKSSPFVDETQRVATEDDDVYHFIAYTPVNGVLYELDGLQPAPISHGKCEFQEFPTKVVEVLQRRIARYPATEIRFNLLAMIRDPRIGAKEIGDYETMHREETKRSQWMFENALRRHNFVGFAGEMLKLVVANKVEEGKYDEWVEGAKSVTSKRYQEQKRQGIAEDEQMTG